MSATLFATGRAGVQQNKDKILIEGKEKRMKGVKHNPRMTPVMRLASFALAMMMMMSPISGFGGNLPTGGAVVHGQVDISQTGNAMHLNQATGQAIVNWESFSIGSGFTCTPCSLTSK